MPITRPNRPDNMTSGRTATTRTRVEAKFLGFQSGCVRLEGHDGKIRSVDFLRLSPESRGQALNRAAVPERISGLIQRMANGRFDALALLRDRMVKVKEDLAVAKRGTIDKNIKDNEQRTESSRPDGAVQVFLQ